MKDYKNGASPALSQFAKDKRLRQPREEAPARRDESRRTFESKPKRSSYNPNFTDDNRLRGESEERPRRSFQRDNDGEHRPFGRKPFGEHKPYGERTERKSFGERTGRNFNREGGEERAFGERPKRAFGDKPFGGKTFGDKKAGGKSFGNKSFGSKPGSGKFGDRKFGDQKYAGRKPFGKGRNSDEPKAYPKYNPAKIDGSIRLNRFVAQSGLCSRREADQFITAGVVSVNGVVVTELGTKVMPGDDVRFNGERIQGEKNVYLILNKPKGYVTTLEDNHADKIVSELVKGACTERIYPVGRLDKNSLGLLLFTNDGDITRQLTHPSYKKKKIYEVALDKPLTRADFDQLAEGVTLEDGDAYFDEISYLKDDKKSVGVEIHSGRNRIVRRMFEHLGYVVTKLDRVYYAGLTKKNLKRGAWRFLTDDEVNRLKSGRYE